jgi:hypothetical protein
MMTDGVEGLQFCGRQWIEFASLGKTAALMQQVHNLILTCTCLSDSEKSQWIIDFVKSFHSSIH